MVLNPLCPSTARWSSSTYRKVLTQMLLVMNFTAIFLFVVCLSAGAHGYTQVTIQQKNSSLPTIFKELKKQTGYDFVYSSEQMQQVGKVTVNLQNVSLEDALAACLKGKGLTYTIVDRTIVIKVVEKSVATVDAQIDEMSATIDMSGKVTDTEGKPLEGASVTVKGTKIATRTDASGVFILKGIDEEATLEISFAEYETVILKVNKRSSISIALKQEIGKLAEVIINKGYYTEKQKFSVGNVTHIDAKTIEKHPVQNVLLALQGRVPGLEITQLSGVNGGGVQVRIQGNNSIGTQASAPGGRPKTGTDPLIVVDGVPVPSQILGSETFTVSGAFGLTRGDSPLNYLNPSDIESIDILKDADATAIYGSRAANGAILITTKKAKAGKMKLTLNLKQGWGKVTRFADMMNTQQYLQMRREAFKNDNLIPSGNPNATGLFAYAPDLFFWDTTRYTNWQKLLIGNTAKYTNIGAYVNGGNDAVQYLIGGTYNSQGTVFPGNYNNESGSLHFNVASASRNQKLRLQLTGNYQINNNGMPGGGLMNRALSLAPNAPALYTPDGSLNWAQNANGTSTWDNPLAYSENAEFNNITKNLISNLAINYKIIKGLEFSSSFGYTNFQANTFIPTRIESIRPERRPTTSRSASFVNRNGSGWIIEPQISYQGVLGRGRISGLIGTTIQKGSADILNIFASGFPSDELMKTLLSASSITILGSNSVINRYNAGFFQLNYTWKDKWIMNFTARRDGSNRYGDNNKFNDFWSAGAGWIFSEESFFKKNVEFLSFGKLRASYGFTGNDQIGDYSYLSVYSINRPTILYQNSIGLQSTNLANPYLEWERTIKLQAGLDLAFWEDRINLGITYSCNRSDNQVISSQLPTQTGFASVSKNLPATVQNTSWELMVNTVPVKAKNFTWQAGFNVTIPRNKIIKFPGFEKTDYSSGNFGIIPGQPIGVLKLYRYAGINPQNGVPSVYAKGSGGFISINMASPAFAEQILVSPSTDYYGGFNNSLRYKQLSLDFLIRFNKQPLANDFYWYNSFLVNVGGTGGSGGTGNQPASVLINRWQKPGDHANYARYISDISSAYNIAAMRTTNAFYNMDGYYVRLQNLSLSWQVPSAWLNKYGMQHAKLSVLGQNLFTKTNYTGLDPEPGINLPPQRLITIAATIGF